MIWNKGGSQVTPLCDRNPYMETVWKALAKQRDGLSFVPYYKLTERVDFL